MSFLGTFHGTLATVVLCVLLFAEESGVPLPLVPGDVLLVYAGILIASGGLSPWLFIPLAVAAATGGALLGYSWTRLLGAPGLRALAGRLGMAARLERLERRVRSSGPAGLLVARLLIPGMRVNTTLLAGALGVSRRIFMATLIPSVVVWVVAMVGVGMVVGVPVEHVLGAIDHLALEGGLLLVVGIAGYVAARHVPPLRRGEEALLDAPAWWRWTLAVTMDLTTIASIVAGGDALARAFLGIGGINDVVDGSVTVGITAVAYFVAIRGGVGVTAGEALFGVRYRARRGRHMRAAVETPCDPAC
jgi:membrane protein DedA with SNARE-associated domain